MNRLYEDLKCAESNISMQYAVTLVESAQNAALPILEVGCWLGRSLGMLAHGVKTSGQTVYAVDPWAPMHWIAGEPAIPEFPSVNRALPMCLSLLAEHGLRENILPIVATSAMAAKKMPPGLAFGVVHIDGNHEYEYVKLDLALWTPRIAQGGILIMHDAGYRPGEHCPWPGVDRAVDEWLGDGEWFGENRPIPSTPGCAPGRWFFRK